MEFRVLELFSGIGGMHYAFKFAQLPGHVVAAVDINTIANTVYAHNHTPTPVRNNNIQSITARHINHLGANMLLMSPPCQPHTRVGNQLDTADRRSDALQHLCAILPECDTLEYILMENVKGFERSLARQNFIETLVLAGYFWREFILSPTHFGVPNTRYRYYCLARKNRDFSFEGGRIWENLPLDVGASKKEPMTVGTLLEPDNAVAAESYLPDKVLQKRVWLMDIVTADSANSMCFTKAYTHYSEGTGSVYTPCERVEMDEIFKLVKELNNEDEKLKLLRKLRLRYFTPREVARLMSFPESFSFPTETTNRQCYRLLGNSINVRVVGELIKLLCS